jgi:hypothetical protein
MIERRMDGTFGGAGQSRARRAGGGAVTGSDPTAPDIEGARRRYQDWTFWREGRSWLARRNGETAVLTGLSLESLEGKVARAEKARAAKNRPPSDKPG